MPKSKVTLDMEKRIVKASELHDPTKLLVYARAKVGKTRLAASAPNVLIIDVDERGTKSIRRDLDTDVFRMQTWLEFNEVYWWLQEGNHNYQSVAIDGVTGLQRLCMNFVLGEATALDASRDPDMPSRQAWGKVGQLMRTQITNYRNLDLNVIFTALTRINREGGEDDEMADTMMGPAVSPSIASHLEAAVDIIGYLFKRQVVIKKKGGGREKVVRRRLLLEATERYLVGDRTGTLPPHIDAPDLTEIFGIINSKEA